MQKSDGQIDMTGVSIFGTSQGWPAAISPTIGRRMVFLVRRSRAPVTETYSLASEQPIGVNLEASAICQIGVDMEVFNSCLGSWLGCNQQFTIPGDEALFSKILRCATPVACRHNLSIHNISKMRVLLSWTI